MVCCISNISIATETNTVLTPTLKSVMFPISVVEDVREVLKDDSAE